MVDVAELRAAIEGRLDALDVRVETNAFGDVAVIVVSNDFDGLDPGERSLRVEPLLADPSIDAVITLTPQEAGEYASNGLRPEPFWPDALARGVGEVEPVFPTDLDVDIEAPVVATFYSLRGGVGRSTALAHTARELASRGRSVVAIDMDFEAPGLAALFGVEDEVREGGGLPATLLDLERGEDVDLADRLVRLDQSRELYLIPAGRPGPEYARILSLISPELWFREDPNPLWRLLDGIKALAISPDVILIDARTGLSPLSAPLLFEASDLAVIAFFPHPQAREGTAALTRALLASRTRRSTRAIALAPEPRFLVSPLPAASQLRERYEVRARDWISDWLEPANTSRSDADALIPEDLCHFIAYGETAAASDRIGVEAPERTAYSPVADWVDALLPVTAEGLGLPVTPAEKEQLLRSISFSTGTAETQERFAEAFVPTEPIQRALSSSTPLVLGRKGTGKTAVFRRLAETDASAIVVTAPDAFRRQAPWALGPEGYEALDGEATANWRAIWQGLIGIATWQRIDPTGLDLVPEEFAGALQPLTQSVTQANVVRALRQILALPDSALMLTDWVADQRERTMGGTLLFDGLDTGFGSNDLQRERRDRAIAELLPLVLERTDTDQRLRFKVLLREDIWRKLSFQNKSHFFGRSVTLEWQDQVDYLRTAVNQALLSPLFASSIEDRVLAHRPIEQWSADEVLIAWSALVGERMKGGKTTFTRNWVWNRLADGNGDHSPRSLLQLFYSAREWELTEEPVSPYDRSVIRPRALIESLAQVSTESLAALEEEFLDELRPMLVVLRRIGRTPLDASELDSVADLIEISREVGLLEVYEGEEDDVRRYRIPDLFRLGLGMTRMGQI